MSEKLMQAQEEFRKATTRFNNANLKLFLACSFDEIEEARKELEQALTNFDQKYKAYKEELYHTS